MNTSTIVRNLIKTASTRPNGTVTADDAQRYLNRRSYKGNRNFLGSLFKNNFRSVGYTHSEIESSRSRTIRVWKPVVTTT